MGLSRWVGRAIGLNVHRDFCVVAICEEGEVRTGARVPSTPDGLAVLAESLLASDRVALEVTGSCWRSRGSSSRTSIVLSGSGRNVCHPSRIDS
jgi:hypothetical protein